MARSKPSVTLEFMVGLPGSGKTTLAKEIEHKRRGKAKRIDFDASFELRSWHTANEHERARIIRDIIHNNIPYQCPDTLIMDGLFLTMEDVVRAVDAAHTIFSTIEIGIHQWNEDRETCVKNDGGRREIPSTNTILNAEFDSAIDVDKINKRFEEIGCTNAKVAWIKYHKVQLKPDWERYFRGKAFVYDDGKIRSERWCTGGTYGSCWSDSLSPVSGEPQPDFEELDDLLADICPGITFLQYKKIMRSCVTIEESYDSDYYGGGCNYNRYICDIKKLYETLEELGCIKKTET